MSEGDFEPAKEISRERLGDTTFVTIEVSSAESFHDYNKRPKVGGQVISVRTSESCPKEDRTLIKQVCYYTPAVFYEPCKDEDRDDQPPRGGDHGESSEAGQEKNNKDEEEEEEEEEEA